MCPRQPEKSRPRAVSSVSGTAACLALGALGLAPAALPADEASPADAAAAETGGLHEIIVYARRRAEPVEETPLAISVRTGEDLREASAVLLEDLGRDVPNTHMYASPQSVSALDVSIRGQTVNRDAIVFDSAVGLYVDGVYVASGQGAMATLLDIDSVEILRGSQGTLFGRDNTGGSILLLTHRPELDRASAELATSVGDYGEFMGRAIANVPLSDTFGLRFAFQSNDRDGFGSSVSSGQDNLENQRRWQARAGALWKPDGATEVYLTWEHFQAREAGAILHPLEGPPPGTLVAQLGGALANFSMIPGIPTVAFPSNPYQTDGNFPARDDATTDSLQLTASHTLANGAALKLILGYRHLDATTALDVDASTLPLADSTLLNTSNEKSAELQLNDKVGRLDWVAGLYWFRDNGAAPSQHAPASPQFLNALGTVATDTGCGVAAPTCLNLVPLFSPLPVYETNSVVNNSEAAYLHGEYQLTSDWYAAAGLRRTDDRRELDENDYVLVPVPTIPGNGPEEVCTIGGAPPGPCPPDDHSVSYQFWSWELSTRYRLTPELNAYARIGRSQRSGGWNVPVASLNDQPFRPEQLTDFEVGLKADLLDHSLLINGDVFYGKYDDMQRLLAELINGTPATLVTNAGRARISGAELETMWQVAQPLRVQASFGYTDARYISFLYQPLAQSGIPGGGPVVDLSGNDFYQTPRYQASLAAIVELPTAVGNVTVRADYAWQDKVQFNVINDFNYQPSYGTLNGRVALASTARTWELALFGYNLTDKRYSYTGGTVEAFSAGPGGLPTPTPTISWNIPGAPRTYGIEGTYRWNPAH